MQVTKEKGRVEKSVALSVLAYLLLLKLYGAGTKNASEVSLFRLKERFRSDLYQEQIKRTERKWRSKLDKQRLAA
jgi:hypothetical protein